MKLSVFFSCTNVALILLMLKVKEEVHEINDTMQVLVKMQQSKFTSTEEFLTTSAVEQFFTRRVYFSLESCKCMTAPSTSTGKSEFISFQLWEWCEIATGTAPEVRLANWKVAKPSSTLISKSKMAALIKVVLRAVVVKAVVIICLLSVLCYLCLIKSGIHTVLCGIDLWTCYNCLYVQSTA